MCLKNRAQRAKTFTGGNNDQKRKKTRKKPRKKKRKKNKRELYIFLL